MYDFQSINTSHTIWRGAFMRDEAETEKTPLEEIEGAWEVDVITEPSVGP